MKAWQFLRKYNSNLPSVQMKHQSLPRAMATDQPPVHCRGSHTPVCFFASVGIALSLCSLVPHSTQADPPTVPQPFVCMYGHHDGAGVDEEFRKIIPPFSVVEGTSSDADFIKELQAQGVIYAAHVNNPNSATTAELVAHWRGPFDNNLGGELTNGFDAIAIDELRNNTNGSIQSDRVCQALQELRGLYPDKLIFAAATWHLGSDPATYSNQLNAVNAYADMFMLEVYIREGNPSYGWLGLHGAAYAPKIEVIVPGILNKTVYGLWIAQHGFVADDTTSIGFWGHLDEQFHRIRNDGDASTMPGVMFWAYYNSETELTPDYVARLVDHYYIQSNTTYFSDGNTAQLITNPSFESDTSDWTLTNGTGGTVDRFDYAGAGVRADHSADPIRNMGQGPQYISHGSYGLRMIRGSTYSKASYQIAVDTGTTYTVSAWVLANVDNRRAKVTITESDDTYIDSEEIFHAGTYDYARIAFSFVPPSSPIKIVLNDESTASSTTLYWDFIELEAAYLTDRDEDGMADDWEMAYFHSTASSSGGLAEDWDKDGFRDLHEYCAGTDPTDADSLLTISNLSVGPVSNAIITWYGVTDKFYSVFRSTNLFEPWSLSISNIAGISPLNVHTVTVDASREFYRIGLEK